MKNSLWKKRIAIICLAICLIFLVPLIINILFKLHSPWNILVAEWTAGDALSYYGALLASVATIIGVYASVEHAQRNYRNDERNKVRPFFALTELRTRSKFNILSFGDAQAKTHEESEEVSNLYEEYKLKKFYIVIDEEGKINYKVELDDSLQQVVEKNGFAWRKDNNNRWLLTSEPFVSIPLGITNIGNGGAINTKIAFYKSGTTPEAIPLFTVMQGENNYIHIVSKKVTVLSGNNYKLEIKYGDILGNMYSQKYPIEFNYDTDSGHFYRQIDLAGMQEMADVDTEAN